MTRAYFITFVETSEPLAYHSSYEGFLDTPKESSRSDSAGRILCSLIAYSGYRLQHWWFCPSPLWGECRQKLKNQRSNPIFVCRDERVHKASIALVGFSDGYARGYSKSGQVVISEQLHSEAVTKVSFMWPSPTSRSSVYQVWIMHACLRCSNYIFWSNTFIWPCRSISNISMLYCKTLALEVLAWNSIKRAELLLR